MLWHLNLYGFTVTVTTAHYRPFQDGGQTCCLKVSSYLVISTSGYNLPASRDWGSPFAIDWDGTAVGRWSSFRISTMILVLLVILYSYGVAAVSRTSAGVSGYDEDEMKSVNVTEGGDVSISIQISRADTDPQVLVTRLRNSSDELIAQLMCHSGDCESDTWLSGASLLYDGHNVTLVLMNVSQTQTGLYELKEMSSTLTKSTVCSVTVFKAPVGDFSSAHSLSVVSSKGLRAGGITAGVICSLGLITAAIYHFYWKRTYDKVSQQDDSAASSQSGSLQVIVNS